MISGRLGTFILALAIGVMTLVAMPAQANITITPTIVVIDGRSRYADVHVVNTTSSRQTYEISWKYMEMREDNGRYQGAEKSLTEFDLAQNIVFTPRRVTLGPKAAQKIRLAMRLKGEPPAPGDYRAHLQLVSVGKKNAQSELDDPRAQSMNVNVNLGFSIPVIYRVGDVDGGKATIGDIRTQINPKTNRIEAVVPINRAAGPYGVMGTLAINYDGKRVGQLRNANVFPEISSREFVVPLNVQNLAGGTLEVVYSDYNIEKDHIFDRKSVSIGR